YLVRSLINNKALSLTSVPNIGIMPLRTTEGIKSGELSSSLGHMPLSSTDIEKELLLYPEHEMESFFSRHTFDLVVYHDQDSDSVHDEKNVMKNLFKCIYETEYKKQLTRNPVLLSGGFKSWLHLMGESWVERNVCSEKDEESEHSDTQDGRKDSRDKSKRNGLIILDESLNWLDSFGDPRPFSSSPPKKESFGEQARGDTYTQPNDLQTQYMTGENYSTNQTINTPHHNYDDFDDFSNITRKPVSFLPDTSERFKSFRPSPTSLPLKSSQYLPMIPSSLSNVPNAPNMPSDAPDVPSNAPILNKPLNDNEPKNTRSGFSLQRRRTIFDHPYYGFSEVKNPEYAASLPKRFMRSRQLSPLKKLSSESSASIASPKSEGISKKDATTNAMPVLHQSSNINTQMAVRYNSDSAIVPQHRHFPISESIFSRLESGIGITGLKNLGNTCFMNSIIQCLSGTIPFSRYFLDGSYKRHINKVNPLGTKGVLAETFAALIRLMWSGAYTFVSPASLKEAISHFAPQFSGSDQHDSQEFLAFILDGLHEDLNVIKEKPIIKELTEREEQEMESLPPQIASEIEWEKHLTRNSSVVVSLFQGQLRSRLMCLTCKRTSTSYNAFMCLSLPIPAKRGKRVDLEMCLKHFVKEEILDGDNSWHCPNCNSRRRASKQLSISRLPDVLLIHLKRFSFNGPFRDKLEMMVDFPIWNLNLTAYVLPPIPQPTPASSRYRWRKYFPGTGGLDNGLQQIGPYVYDLYAVSNHYGGLD
ncbi:6568_t:CDS:2, partial [Acaulospora colombiana]